MLPCYLLWSSMLGITPKKILMSTIFHVCLEVHIRIVTILLFLPEFSSSFAVCLPGNVALWLDSGKIWSPREEGFQEGGWTRMLISTSDCSSTLQSYTILLKYSWRNSVTWYFTWFCSAPGDWKLCTIWTATQNKKRTLNMRRWVLERRPAQIQIQQMKIDGKSVLIEWLVGSPFLAIATGDQCLPKELDEIEEERNARICKEQHRGTAGAGTFTSLLLLLWTLATTYFL